MSSIDRAPSEPLTHGRNTRKLVIMALFVALSTMLSFVELPIFPAAAFLKYDPSACIAMFAAFAFGPIAGILVGALSAILHGLVTADAAGTLMTIITIICWVVPASLIFRIKRSRVSAVIGLAVGCVFAVLGAIGGNLLITPVYLGVSVTYVENLIVPALLPFNVLKMLLNGILVFALFKPVIKLIER